jgi:TonB family protein
MSRTRITALLVFCSSAFCTISAADQDLEKQFAAKYHNKVLYLRHSYTSDSQEYDAEGDLAKAGQEGPWSLYGRMVVRKIVFDKDSLRVEGKRAVYRTDGQLCGKDCMPFKNGKSTTIKIRLNDPLASMSEAESVLSHVFAITPEDEVSSVPSYWQDYMAKLFALQPKQPDADSEKTFKVGEHRITAPKPTYVPEPEFTEAARKERFAGIVGLSVIVDKAGEVRRVSIQSPLGMGLDEQAANTVRTWRFSPATKDGEPVAIAMFVEVDFHLYGRR